MLKTIGFPGRYIQGPKALAALAELLRELGLHKPVMLADAVVRERVLPATVAALQYGGYTPSDLVFAGECTATAIAELSREAALCQPDVIIALGGGKTVDAAKGVACTLGISIVVCPTVASNDAPTSRLIVLYDENHRLAGVEYLNRNPDAVVVDTEIIVHAPARFFAAGIGDAISKKFEARQCHLAQGSNSYGTPPLHTALMMADSVYETIVRFGPQAYRDVKRQSLTPEVERLIEGTVLLSGIGFESGGLSLAHALIRGLTAIPEIASKLHGELVAFGTLIQVIVEDRPQTEVEELLATLSAVDLPTNFAGLGKRSLSAAEMQTVVETTLAASYSRNISPPLTPERLTRSLEKASRVGIHAASGSNKHEVPQELVGPRLTHLLIQK